MPYFEKDKIGSSDYLRFLFPSFYKYEVIETSEELSPIEKKSISRDIRDNLRTDTDNGTQFGHRIGRIRRTFDMRGDVLFGITFPSSTASFINLPNNLKIKPIPENKYDVAYMGAPLSLLLLGSFHEHEMYHFLQILSPLLMEFWWEKFIHKTVRGDKLEPPKQKYQKQQKHFPLFPKR